MSIDKSEITIVMVSFFSKNLIEKPINSIDQNIKTDGLLTKSNNIVLGILTADCAPIFFF